jgi:hypothetical protein
MYFHDSSWSMRETNGYDGRGCNGHSCIPECEYFKPSLYPRLLPLLKVCEDNRHLLGRSCLANQQQKQYEAETNDFSEDIME